VCRYLITASDDARRPGGVAGPFIPIVPVVGEEIRIGRKLIRNGVIRHAKDPQRIVELLHSAHTETVALAAKAPFLVTETKRRQVSITWEQANTKNFPYLPYEPRPPGTAAPRRSACSRRCRRRAFSTPHHGA